MLTLTQGRIDCELYLPTKTALIVSTVKFSKASGQERHDILVAYEIGCMSKREMIVLSRRALSGGHRSETLEFGEHIFN